MAKSEKAYKNLEFLNSQAARTIRILCEYEEPRARLAQEGIHNTVVMFGSARIRPEDEAQGILEAAEAKAASATDAERAEAQAAVETARKRRALSKYYGATRELARRLTEWSMNRNAEHDYYVCSGGGPGIMEAANRGAADVPGGRSVGLGISLPFEEDMNAYITEELAFEFHYFFMRKLWFLYLAQAIVIFPGGFGTLDEMFEALTLRQTRKITRPIPMVLFGKAYWQQALNFEAMVEAGTISAGDLDLFFQTDSVDEAFAYLTAEFERIENANEIGG